MNLGQYVSNKISLGRSVAKHTHLGLLISEEMSGWIEVNGKRESFRVVLEAFTDKIFLLTVPRAFTGVVYVGDSAALPTEGILTIHPSGPAYEFSFLLPETGTVQCKGKKQYQLSRFIASLITCPLIVTYNNQKIGKAKVVYKKPLWQFPLESVRLAQRRIATTTKN
jgi:hypothetical protein